ncbi:sigma-54 interaction domain-containing protein [Stieleria varia]|uniref:Nif-specific regulatory protein n=1 Tax=Stieleria varia TaxID=2528005 RepID=A0A5C6AR09_9BACT|nr:sigma-54 dependent transcriptional regulator [Stieleria varia]TWU02160.1 Nif-specific regulatory protein [Stieleria varia]
MIISQSIKIRDLIRLAKRAARSSAPVLLIGESGTGKELFAQLIHQSSPRCEANFVRVNCAALSSQLIESELFGHKRGAFTDAVSDRVGRFELAHRGTLLLDEVTEVPTATQAKLLRVLESQEYESVGSSDSVRHDVRIIASTNKDLAQEVDNGMFRLDLFHRLNVIPINIPPLRQRPEDIPALAMHFVARYKHEGEASVKGFTKDAMRRLARHQWPGNVRELRNLVHRACILCDSELIDVSDLQITGDDLSTNEPSNHASSSRHHSATGRELPEHWLESELAEVEREIILAAIDKYGNRNVVAKKLGVSPRTLSNKVRQYRLLGQQTTDAA